MEAKYIIPIEGFNYSPLSITENVLFYYDTPAYQVKRASDGYLYDYEAITANTILLIYLDGSGQRHQIFFNKVPFEYRTRINGGGWSTIDRNSNYTYLGETYYYVDIANLNTSFPLMTPTEIDANNWTSGYSYAHMAFYTYYHGTEYIPPTDPYAGGGISASGGGSGTFDGSSSDMSLPSAVPSAGALNSGFIKVFNPSAANVSALASYLWGTFDIQTFKSIYNNPIDCIIALLVVPVTPTVGAAATISLGNVATTVSAPVVSDQFVILDCGSLNIQEYWGAYLDYDPYTKVEIYLPYIGVRDIDVNDIQGKTVQLKYYIDVLSGTCVAMLQCGSDVLYSWSGQCAAEIPITSTGFGSTFQTALSAGNAIGETIVNAMSGIPQNISQVASSVFNGARSKVHKSGSLGSMAGHMGIQTPYLILTRPQQSVPEDLNKLTGYPSNITATLSDLEGYTEIDVIYPENIPATSAEIDEIVQLLKDGVIL